MRLFECSACLKWYPEDGNSEQSCAILVKMIDGERLEFLVILCHRCLGLANGGKPISVGEK